MNRLSRFLFAAATLALVSAPVFAEDNDDLLRPMIVRPTEGAAPSSTQPSPSAGNTMPESYTPASAPPPASSPSESTLIAQAAATEPPSDAHLKLPPIPKATPINMAASPGRAIATAPAGRNLFADFGPPSGSVVSDRVFQLRDEAIALHRNIDQNDADYNELKSKGAAGAIQYHATVAAIQARLEAGTTRNNPVLLRQWNEAEQSLTEVNYPISKLNGLETDLSANAATCAYLLQAVRATFELSGAVEDDHQQLAMIRDTVANDTIRIDHTRSEVIQDIQRETTYLSIERQNLQTLALGIERGELLHNSLASKTVVVANPTTGSLPGTSSDYSGYPSLSETPAPDYQSTESPDSAPFIPVQKSKLGRKPVSYNKGASAKPIGATPENSLGQLLVLVRFNQDDVDYEQQLYQAVSDALDRRPNASFTVVAVAPKGVDPASIGSDVESAQRHADAVKNSLVQLGLQPSRISMTNISSEAAQSPEVHVYIR